jgi:hypothetical protein
MPILVEPRSCDTLSLGSRQRKGSGEFECRNSVRGELEWRYSVAGNFTFLAKSLASRSSLGRNEEFNFHEETRKELSEKSCPVGSDENDNFYLCEKVGRPMEEGEAAELAPGKEKQQKKFLKTKNLLRNLSSYLHKYIKYNPRCRSFILRYLLLRNRECDELESEEFQQSFLEWVGELNLTNFQDYQRVWTQDCKFTSLYRQICYKYYREDLYCDGHASRLSCKPISQQYTPQFSQGLLNPQAFTHVQNE